MTISNTPKDIGKLGEEIASVFLMKQGFTILERNYWRKWGELDIVAKKGDRVHFVEVKTVSHETKAELERNISRETWRPEEQVHQFKLHQIQKALETWIADHNYDGDWQIDVIGVRVVPRETFSTVNLIENIAN
jgi:putative endonuclease